MALKVDDNGFLTFTDTTFFRGGVFEYAGCEIDPGGKVWNLEQKRLYKVFRDPKEVTNPDFVKTLNAKPLVDDHTIIGNGPGMVKPEKKNCAGVLTDVVAKGDELHGTVSVWSTKMISKIRSGKRELSLAYGCEFRKECGVYKGQRYDFVQSGLKVGNHLALVDEARNGHDCRVVDCAFVCDSKFQLEQTDMDWKTLSADDLVAGLKECSDECKAKAKEFLNTPTEDEKKELEKKAAEKAEADKKAAEEAKAAAEQEKKEAVDKAVAEANETAKKQADEVAKQAEKDKSEACDAAFKEGVKVGTLASDCKGKYGTVAIDGIKTEQALAVKVCSLDSSPSSLKNLKPEECVAALRNHLAGRQGSKPYGFVSDGKTQKTSFEEYRATR